MLWAGIECEHTGHPKAELWKEVDGTHWAYTLDTGTGDDLMAVGFDTEDEAREQGKAHAARIVAEAAGQGGLDL